MIYRRCLIECMMIYDLFIMMYAYLSSIYDL